MKVTRTARKIISMLKENTGRHFLDSGGAYERHWERNQGRDFLQEDSCFVSIRANDEGEPDEIMVTFNLFHFLNAYLEYDEQCKKWEKAFFTFADSDERWLDAWPEVIESFMVKKQWEDLGGCYTYGQENILSQDIQFWQTHNAKGDNLLILQIHNGCDARSGFTVPAIFKLCEPDYFYMAMSHIDCGCNGGSPGRKAGADGLFNLPQLYCDNNWMSDDGGYHWYYDGSSGNRKPLKDTTIYDEETKELHCKECGGLISFSVMDSY